MTKFEQAINIVDKTMCETGTKYAFISGTALGLAREGKCLDYDTDVDFCIHVSDRNRLDGIHSRLLKNGLEELSRMNFGNRVEAIGYGIPGDTDWVELDFLHSRGEEVWYSAFVGEDSPWITKVYPRAMWDNLEHIIAYGVRCPVFSPIAEYVRMLYGDDWRTPNPAYFHQELFRKTAARRYDWDLGED